MSRARHSRCFRRRYFLSLSWNATEISYWRCECERECEFVCLGKRVSSLVMPLYAFAEFENFLFTFSVVSLSVVRCMCVCVHNIYAKPFRASNYNCTNVNKIGDNYTVVYSIYLYMNRVPLHSFVQKWDWHRMLFACCTVAQSICRFVNLQRTSPMMMTKLPVYSSISIDWLIDFSFRTRTHKSIVILAMRAYLQKKSAEFGANKMK